MCKGSMLCEGLSVQRIWCERAWVCKESGVRGPEQICRVAVAGRVGVRIVYVGGVGGVEVKRYFPAGWLPAVTSLSESQPPPPSVTQ